MIKTIFVAIGLAACLSSAAMAHEIARVGAGVTQQKCPPRMSLAQCRQVCTQVFTGYDAAGREVFKLLCRCA